MISKQRRPTGGKNGENRASLSLRIYRVVLMANHRRSGKWLHGRPSPWSVVGSVPRRAPQDVTCQPEGHKWPEMCIRQHTWTGRLEAIMTRGATKKNSNNSIYSFRDGEKRKTSSPFHNCTRFPSRMEFIMISQNKYCTYVKFHCSRLIKGD